jgi:hypothetical protein
VVEGADAVAAGFKVCGRVARPVAASPWGRNKGPLCPQPATAIAPLKAMATRR